MIVGELKVSRKENGNELSEIKALGNGCTLSPMTHTLIAGAVVPFRGAVSQPPMIGRLGLSGDLGHRIIHDDAWLRAITHFESSGG